jgi:hypothetical protein
VIVPCDHAPVFQHHSSRHRREALRLLVVLSAAMRINWKEVCKFLAGAFFVSAGVLFYLRLTNTPVPILGTDFVVAPEVNGLRSIAHFVFFVICFYLGFIRKSSVRP